MLKKIIVVLLFSSLIALHTSFLLASEINLPRTGQTLCYNEAGTVIICTGTGQDGDILAGQPAPSPRFIAANGAVTDNLTGLVWLQNANCSATLGGIVKTTTLTWTNALAWSNALASGSCGLTDGSTAGQWRLPTRLELESLVDASNISPALPEGHPFTDVQIYETHWTSSTSANPTDATWAWFVRMNVGTVGYGLKTESYYVLPVRGGM